MAHFGAPLTAVVAALGSVQDAEAVKNKSLRFVLSYFSTVFSTAVLKNDFVGRTQGWSNKKAAGLAAHIWKQKILSSHLFQEFLIHIEVRVHVLHVVVFLESLNQTDHLRRLLAFELDIVLWNHGNVGGNRSKAGFLHRFQYRFIG